MFREKQLAYIQTIWSYKADNSCNHCYTAGVAEENKTNMDFLLEGYNNSVKKERERKQVAPLKTGMVKIMQRCGLTEWNIRQCVSDQITLRCTNCNNEWFNTDQRITVPLSVVHIHLLKNIKHLRKYIWVEYIQNVVMIFNISTFNKQ